MKRKLRVAATLSALVVLIVTSPAAALDNAATVVIPEVVVSTSPIAGAVGISSDKVPAQISTVPAEAFGRIHSPSVTDALEQAVPGAISTDVNGNAFQQEFRYRGFVASPVEGTAQGLAVYQNGVRINEAFGDSVNFDLVPPIAIDHADVYTNNPIFGLNALGGAINFTMKNGFTYQGFEASVLGGSYGRVNGNFQYGKQVDNFSAYVAGDAVRDSGFRPFSKSNLERVYGDLGYKTQDGEFHLIASGGQSHLGVIGPTPTVLIDQQGYNSVFTNPQTTSNQVGSVQFTGRVDVTPTWSVGSNFYIRHFDQHHVDGNDGNYDDCANVFDGSNSGQLCLQQGSFAPNSQTPGVNPFLIQDQQGKSFAFQGGNFPYGEIDETFVHTTTVGTTLQATNKDTLFGHDNYFVIGGSVDRSDISFSSTATLGQINNALQVVTTGFPGAGSIIQTNGSVGFAPVHLQGSATYFGLYALDTFNVTPELALTAGARFNIANVATADLTGTQPDINGTANYDRINPVVGATYKFSSAVTVYGGYSEANRAPTPLETNCANPARPCLLSNFVVSDPPLKQVVSHTIEGGARGMLATPEGGDLSYKIGYFHTDSSDDIVPLASQITGLGYYTNVAATRRQGIEAGARYAKGDWELYGNYSFVDATFQFTGALASRNNPSADPITQTVLVTPGNKIPGSPRHQAKLGADYAVTPKLKIGGDAILVGSQYFVGDDANQNPQLPFYYVLNAHASYQVTDHIQVFGLINNLLDRKYATYGSYYAAGPGGSSAQSVSAILANNANSASPDFRSVTAAQPLSIYAGIKVTF